MAKTTTAPFTIEIPCSAGDGTVVCQKYVLTLTLSMAPMDLEAEGSIGEITINGAVPPVDDHPLTYQEGDVPLEAGGTTQIGDSMQQAA